MALNDAAWAKVGKVVIFLGAAIGLIYTTVQLIDRFSGPRLVAVVSVSEQYLHPETRKTLGSSIDSNSIIGRIDALGKRGRPPREILEAVREMATEEKDLRLDLRLLEHTTQKHMLTVMITNNRDEAAEDVRLVLPGSGWFHISEFLVYSRGEEPLAWKSEIRVGVIRPGARMEVRVWPSSSTFWENEYFLPAVIHSKGGGTVRWSRQFHGWDADLVFWYLAQSTFTRYGLASLVLLVITAVIWYLVSRKHLTFSLRGNRSANGTNQQS